MGVDTVRPLGEMTQQIVNALDDIGPMGSAELSRLLQRTKLSVGDSIRRLRKRKMIYIAKYERQPDGKKGRCIPIYAVGYQPDAPPLRQIGVSQRNKNYRKRHAAIVSARRYVIERKQFGVWSGLL